jgi:23S rRNA (cytosine1962-C5)-methyltransferase
MSPEQLICARLFSRDKAQVLNSSLLVDRINIALSVRDLWFPGNCYRLIFGDSDGLPGLVVDRFLNTLVIQISSHAMEQLKDDIVAALDKVIKPDNIVVKNDGKMRKASGLEEYVEVAKGHVEGAVPLIENDTHFVAPVLDGQKTGWFYDHRMNRKQLNTLVKGKRVLDVFSYIGGWGVQAANSGADQVMCVDSSESALDYVDENAKLNGVEDKVSTFCGDAFGALKALRDEREQFDVVIMDPPALIPRRKDIKNGEQAYRRLNQLAMRLLNKDGLLVSASCSMHLEEMKLQNMLQAVARETDRDAMLMWRGDQSPDHPVVPAILETHYLKALFMRVLPTR